MQSSMYWIHARIFGRGMTFVEVMVTIAIGTILMAIAVPSLAGLVARARISAHVNDFVGAINLARSEAVKSGGGVTICPSSDQASCATATTGWEIGWIVFGDPDLSGTVNGTETVINAFAPLPNGSTAVANVNKITFLGNGRPGATFSGALTTICPSADASACRYVCINSQGRPRVDTPSEHDVDALCGN